MRALLGLLSLVLAALALRGRRWAYAAFVALGLLHLPARTAFRVEPRGCELLVGPALALHSFRNYPHIVLFALFFVVSRAQFSGRRASAWAFLATVGMGALVEIAQGVTGQGHCRLRDLLPDSAGAAVGWLAIAGVQAVRRRRIVGAPGRA